MARMILSALLLLPSLSFAQSGLFGGSVTTLSTPADDDRLLIGDQSNQTGYCCVITYADLITAIEGDLGLATSAVTSGTFADARISESSVTQHQAALSITESQVSDLGSYLTGITGESIGSLSDVTITGPATSDVLQYSGAAWVDRTLAEAGIAAASHAHNLTTDVTGALPVANGGTGATTASGARTALGVDAAGTDNSTNVTLAGTPDYITISGQEITRGQVDLTADVTGTLPVANGGTGVTALSSIDAADLGSGAGTDDYVLTADGLGGAAWEAASGGGVTDHGALTGLSDDDHTQYALVDGTRDFTGDVTVTGGKMIINPAVAPELEFHDSGVQVAEIAHASWKFYLRPGLTTGYSNGAFLFSLPSDQMLISAASLAGRTFAIESPEMDSASAIGFYFDTASTLSTSGATLLELANNSTTKFAVDKDGAGSFAGGVGGTELSADPSDPAEGAHICWQSDGTGSGDDGDIMCKITAGATTKTITLIDFSTF